MMRYVTPPPGVDPRTWPVPGEVQILAKWEGRIRANARKVRKRSRLGMELADVESEMRMALMVAIRRYAAEHGVPPPGAFMTTVLQRRAMHFNRATRVWFRVLDDLVRSHAPLTDADGQEVDCIAQIPSEAASVDQAMSDVDEAQAFGALVYALRENLTPAAFAVLHLRIVEEMTPAEIAEITGLASGTHASRRVAYARSMAAKFLQGLGIHTMEDVEASLEMSHERA